MNVFFKQFQAFFLQAVILTYYFEANSAIYLKNEVARAKAQALIDAAKARVNLIRSKAIANRPVLLGSAPNPVLASRLQKRHYYPDNQDQQLLEAKNNWNNGANEDMQFKNNWPVENQNGINFDAMRTNSNEENQNPGFIDSENNPQLQSLLFAQSELNSSDTERHSHGHFHSHHVYHHAKDFGNGHNPSAHAITPNVNIHLNQHQTTVVTPATNHHGGWNQHQQEYNPIHSQSAGHSFASAHAHSFSTNHATAGTPFIRESANEEVPQIVEEAVPEEISEEELFANKFHENSNSETSDFDRIDQGFSMLQKSNDLSNEYEGGKPEDTVNYDMMREDDNVRQSIPDDIQFEKIPQEINNIHKFESEQFIPSLILSHLDFDLRNAEDGEEVIGANHIELAPEQEAVILSNDGIVGSPYLFDISSKKYKEKRRYERSLPIEFIWNDDILKNDLAMINLIDVLRNKVNENTKVVHKRDVSLSQLINDPNVKMDVSKTMENLGAAAKHALENEKAPLYHLKNLIGSTKNTVLAAMRVPPQNLVIPSNYEIVKTINDNNENVADINRDLLPETVTSDSLEDPLGIYQTFRRVGEVIRESVKSGQDAATHIGDVAHDAKNIIHTAKYSTPKIIVSPIQATSTLKTIPTPNKLTLITPKIIDINDRHRLEKPAADSNPNFVKMGHLMDAVGISNPNSPEPDLHKIVLQSQGNNRFDIVGQPLLTRPKSRERIHKLLSRFRDDDLEIVGQTLNNLENVKLSIGARSLQDFLTKLKNEFLSLFGQKSVHEIKDFDLPKSNQKVVSKPVKKNYTSKLDQKLDHEMNSFVDGLLNNGKKPITAKNKEKIPEVLINSPKQNPENVGGSFIMSPELLKPFMGQPTKTQIVKYLRDNGDNIKEDKIVGQRPARVGPGSITDPPAKNTSITYVDEKNNHNKSRTPLVTAKSGNDTNRNTSIRYSDEEPPMKQNPENVGGSFIMSPELLKPFMGQPTKTQIVKYLRDNGDNIKEDKIVGQRPARVGPGSINDPPAKNTSITYVDEKNNHNKSRTPLVTAKSGNDTNRNTSIRYSDEEPPMKMKVLSKDPNSTNSSSSSDSVLREIQQLLLERRPDDQLWQSSYRNLDRNLEEFGIVTGNAEIIRNITGENKFVKPRQPIVTAKSANDTNRNISIIYLDKEPPMKNKLFSKDPDSTNSSSSSDSVLREIQQLLLERMPDDQSWQSNKRNSKRKLEEVGIVNENEMMNGKKRFSVDKFDRGIEPTVKNIYGLQNNNSGSSDSIVGSINQLLFERITNPSNDRKPKENFLVNKQNVETSEEKSTVKLQKILDAYDQGDMENWDDLQNELYQSDV